MTSFVLWIAAFVAMAFLLFVFGHGIVIAITGESEWTQGKKLHGWRARMIGLAMILSAPLAVAVSMISMTTATIFIDLELQDARNLGFILVAMFVGGAMRYIRTFGPQRSTPLPGRGNS